MGSRRIASLRSSPELRIIWKRNRDASCGPAAADGGIVAITVLSDLRSLLGGARNQGRRPTCVAFAVSDAHAAARGTNELLSTEHLYFHGVQRTPNGHPNLGVSLSTILDALKHDGQCAETGWPY